MENVNATYYGVQLRSYIFDWLVGVFWKLAWTEFVDSITQARPGVLGIRYLDPF